ncbi:PQQ-binding-like beta-propeller repeat protein [uncultured Cellulomonas sp.]|uniref:outer membrane protein assembly factor BamB family protein n=1 Tax=uncultured Cellulomonas sp. TaxID=189682 RepID=UPI002607C8DC|nr:PQQ-binding-like beta-propeller repeat protein [uncultured Cellulomonas sp.]
MTDRRAPEEQLVARAVSGVRVVVDDGQRLDLRPAQHGIVPDPRPSGEVELGPGRRQRLHLWRDMLLHLGDHRVTRLDAPGTADDVAHLFPATDGGPLVLTEDRALHRWTDRGLEPSGPPLPGDPTTVSALGLGPRMLVRDFGGPRTELRATDTGAHLWERAAVALAVLPVGGALVGLDLADRTSVTATELADGAERWRARFGVRVDHLVAAVGDRVWVSLDDGRLQALDVRTGDVRASVTDPAIDAHARGPVTAEASLVLCRSTDVTVVDLVRGEVSRRAVAGPLAVPTFVRATPDGVLVVVDEQRRVWVVDPDGAARHVHTASGLVTGLELHAGRGYVLTAEGRVTVLG